MFNPVINPTSGFVPSQLSNQPVGNLVNAEVPGSAIVQDEIKSILEDRVGEWKPSYSQASKGFVLDPDSWKSLNNQYNKQEILKLLDTGLFHTELEILVDPRLSTLLHDRLGKDVLLRVLSRNRCDSRVLLYEAILNDDTFSILSERLPNYKEVLITNPCTILRSFLNAVDHSKLCNFLGVSNVSELAATKGFASQVFEIISHRGEFELVEARSKLDLNALMNASTGKKAREILVNVFI